MVVGFIPARPRGRRVHSGSLSSFGHAVRNVVFIPVCVVHSGASSGWSGSFVFVGFIQAYPGVRRVHSGSLDSFGRALDVVVFIRDGWVHSGSFGSALLVVGIILVHWVHSGARWCSSGSFGF